MSDELRNPIGTLADGDDGAEESKAPEEDYEEVEDIDDPTVEHASECQV